MKLKKHSPPDTRASDAFGTEPPVDPLDGPKFAISGQIVTMDATRRVLRSGTIFIEKGAIVAVNDHNQPAPEGFEEVAVLDTGGTMYPGLIELHNHLSYNILQLWDVPKKYGNRGNWAGTSEYQTLISGPMGVIGRTPGLLPAVVRYVECKCLLGGVTTSQGVELFSNAGARRFYRGIVRNVEQTNDPALPEAGTRIADVETRDAQSFLARLGQKQCFLLHLAEGLDDTARKHFLSLQFEPGKWAIAPSLSGIHSAALQQPDFDVMASKGASIVWSPLSNLLLYGGTAQIGAAKASGVRMGIGSDWSPSGSKNLLGELKVAHLVSEENGAILSDSDILALATTNAAAILHWEDHLGSLEAGKCADVLVLNGKHKDPYGALLKAGEADLALVLINGVARCGSAEAMRKLGVDGESLTVGGNPKLLQLSQKSADPDVDPISLAQAKETLTDALAHLGETARKTHAPQLFEGAPQESPVWFLALDELAKTGMDLRPHLTFEGQATMALAKGKVHSAAPVLGPMKLDPLTVADDPDFLELIVRERNLPDFVRQQLPSLF